MKKLNSNLTFFFFSAIFAANPANALTLGIEALSLDPTNQDVVLGSDAVDNTSPTFGANDVMNFDSSTGIKLSATDVNWRLSVLNVEPDESFSASHAPASAFTSALGHPTLANGDIYTTVSATSSIKLQIIDFDYLVPLTTSGSAKVTVFTGLRSASYDTELSAVYDAGTVTEDTISRKADNSLFGIRAGLETELPLGTGLSLRGFAAISLLKGESSFTQAESFDVGAAEARRSLKFDTTVPVTELGISLIWKFIKNASAWVGYDVLRFTDVVIAQQFADDVNDATQLEDGINAGFSGIKLGASWSF